MALQIRCYVNGNQEFIDLYGDEDITIDVSFAEIQDPTKKNSTYTQTFKVPGSKNNNKIFDYFYDINSVYLTWNPIKKFEADLLYDGYEIYNGYIRMENVVITGIEKEYNITFYTNVGDVASNIGDKFMRQLDLSHLSHPFNSNVYLQSQVDWNLFPLTGTTNYSYQNGKTFWGLYNIGYDYTNDLSFIASRYQGTSTTTVTINSGSKTIVTNVELPFEVGDTIRLTNGNNYIQGEVTTVNGLSIIFTPNVGLGTGTFSAWDITRQLPEGSFINNPVLSPILELKAPNIPNYMSFSGTPVRNFYFKPSIQIKELYEQIFSQAGYNIESEFFKTNYFERYYLPLKFLDNTLYTKGAIQPCFENENNSEWNPLSGVTCNNVPFSANSTTLLIPSGYSGEYTFTVFTEIELYFNCPPLTTYDLFLSVGTVPVTDYLIQRIPDCLYGTPGTYIVNMGGSVTLNLTGQTEIRVTYPIGIVNRTQFKITKSEYFIVGDFDYSAEFPDNDFKQIDFITSVNKMFNLVCIPHPVKQKTIIIEPIIDYIGKGEILDWTDKIDYNSPIELIPTSTILNGTLNYNFKLDKDYANQEFNIASNRIFGTYQLQLNQDYKDNNINFDTIFSSPIDTTLNTNLSGIYTPNEPPLTISNLSTIKSIGDKSNVQLQFNPYKILPRMLFRGLVLPNQNWSYSQPFVGDNFWYAENNKIDRWQSTNRFTTYPFSFTGFSHYINWNGDDYFSDDEPRYTPQQDMYDIYYYDYISDLTSPENKIMRCKAYLTPWEVSRLRFDEKIVIKNAYFRINKITNLSLLEPGLCDLELVKLTKEYTPHPVKYFKLENCDNTKPDLYTTTDLNYNIYGYIESYVKVFTGSSTSWTSIGCYYVDEIEPDASQEYKQVFIGSGYTSSGVSIFDTCNCPGGGFSPMQIKIQNY